MLGGTQATPVVVVRQDHLHGSIVKSLRERQQELLAEPPTIRQVDLLAVKSLLTV